MLNHLLLDGEPNSMSSLISIGMLVVLFAVFYFFIIRPQKKQEKQTNEMRNSIEVGDEITTIGGSSAPLSPSRMRPWSSRPPVSTRRSAFCVLRSVPWM